MTSNGDNDNRERGGFESSFHAQEGFDAPENISSTPESALGAAPETLPAPAAGGTPAANDAGGLISLMSSRLCLWIAGLSAAIVLAEAAAACFSFGSLSSLDEKSTVNAAALYACLAVFVALGLLNAGGWYLMYKKQTVSLHRGMTRTVAIVYTVFFGLIALLLLIAIVGLSMLGTAYADALPDTIPQEMIPMIQSIAGGVIFFWLLILALPGVVNYLVTCVAGNMRKRLLELPVKHKLAGAVKGFKMAGFVCYCIGFVLIGLYTLIIGAAFNIAAAQFYGETPEVDEMLSTLSQAFSTPLILLSAAAYIASAVETFLEYRFYKKAQALTL